MKAVVCFLAGANAANMVAKQIQAGSGSFYLLGPEGPEVGEPRPPLLHAWMLNFSYDAGDTQASRERDRSRSLLAWRRSASCRGGLGIGHRD